MRCGALRSFILPGGTEAAARLHLAPRGHAPRRTLGGRGGRDARPSIRSRSTISTACRIICSCSRGISTPQRAAISSGNPARRASICSPNVLDFPSRCNHNWLQRETESHPGELSHHGQPHRRFADNRHDGEPRTALRRDPAAIARSGRNALRCGRQRAVDARRVACQMASCAHDMVFRNLHPARPCAGLPPVRRTLSLPLQQLL